MPNQVAALLTDLRSEDESARRLAAEDLGRRRDARAIPELVDALEDPSAAVREAAIEALSTIGAPATVRAVLPALRSDKAHVRNAACVVLRNIGEPAVVHLSQLLDDDDKDVRKFAVDILALIGSASAGEALSRALGDVNINVATAAAEALGEIGYQPAVRKMVAALQANAWVRCAVASSLGKLGGPDANRALVDLIGDSDAMVVFTALRSLGAAGSEDCLQYVLCLLAHENPMIVNAALAALEQIFARVDPQVWVTLRRQIPLEPVLELVRNPQPPLRRSALALLGKVGHPDTVATLVRALAAPENRDHAELRDVAARAIVSIAPRDVEPLLEVLREPGLPPEAACELIDVLGRLGRPAAFDVVAGYGAHAHPSVRRVVARALASIDAERAPVLLARAFSDADGHTRAHAVRSLGALLAGATVASVVARPADPLLAVREAGAWLEAALGFGHGADVLGLLMPLLQDEFPDVREAAAWALGTIGNDAAIGVLCTLLRADHEAARLLAVVGLSATGADPRGSGPLRIALTDPSGTVCAAAIRALMSRGAELNANEIQAALQHAAPGVRSAMVTLLSERRLAPWAPNVLALFQADPDSKVRYTCARALGRFGSAGAGDTLVESLSHGISDPLVVLGAVEALEMLRDERARDLLAKLADSKDPEIHAAARAALAALDITSVPESPSAKRE